MLAKLLVGLLALAASFSIGDKVPYTTYWLASGAQAQIAWDPVANPSPVRYEWENYSPVRQAVMSRGETTQTQVTLAIFSGHNVFKVRACVGEGAELNCSEYSVSIDDTVAQVDGTAKGWWIFGVIGAPGPIDPQT